jgi:hypothetical protein
MRQVELKLYLDYPSCMLRRFSHFFACLLLVLIPLQGIAAANMSICNSMMQTNTKHASIIQTSTQQQAQTMPCHDDMNSKLHGNGKSTSKTSCAALCASLCAMTALPSNIPVASFLASASVMHMPHQTYVSITQPSLQRPPIFFS